MQDLQTLGQDMSKMQTNRTDNASPNPATVSKTVNSVSFLQVTGNAPTLAYESQMIINKQASSS